MAKKNTGKKTAMKGNLMLVQCTDTILLRCATAVEIKEFIHQQILEGADIVDFEIYREVEFEYNETVTLKLK